MWTVTNPSTNEAQCRATKLIKTGMLTLGQMTSPQVEQQLELQQQQQ